MRATSGDLLGLGYADHALAHPVASISRGLASIIGFCVDDDCPADDGICRPHKGHAV